MYWKLNDGVALRSWRMVPHAYYHRGNPFAQKLSPEQYALLSRCDGVTELEPTPALEALECLGLVERRTLPGPILPWQAPRSCDNRYFPALNWAVTGKCNYNCRHCFMAADNAPSMAEFTWEQCLAVLDGCETCGVQAITLTGGEPMLHPRFMDLCREIARRGLDLEEITTNGSFITSAILEELYRLGMRPLIKISFDGLGHHDWLRNHPGAEENALAAIHLCHGMGFPVRVQMNVHRGNLNTLLPTAHLLDTMGVEQLRIIRTTEAPRWAEQGGDLCLTLEEYYDLALDFTTQYLAQERHMEVDIWQFLQFWPKSRSYHLRPVELGCGVYRDSIPVCRGNRGHIAITPEGEVVPCNQMSGYYAKHGMNLGNVKTAGLQPLLQDGPYLEAVTTTVGELFAQNPKCGGCRWRKLCLGGCRAIALALTGDPLGVDPAKCQFFGGGYVERCQDAFPAGWSCMDDLRDMESKVGGREADI